MNYVNILPLALGLIFALLFYFVFDKTTITKKEPRANALWRIIYWIMWTFASIFVLLVVFIIGIINWLYQVLTNKRDIGITRGIVDWWIGWTKVLWYGYA